MKQFSRLQNHFDWQTVEWVRGAIGELPHVKRLPGLLHPGHICRCDILLTTGKSCGQVLAGEAPH